MDGSCAFDVVVVGAGVEGSSCAYTLAKEGKKVLLLEQFPLPHTRGSSHGQSRITRYAYVDEFYVRMMVDAFKLWNQLEQESGQELFINCGTVDFRLAHSKSLKTMTQSLRSHNVPHEILSPQEVQKRFPMVKLNHGDVAVWDPCGGLLKADLALRAFQTVFKQNGGLIRDSEQVVAIEPGHPVTVKTTRGTYLASKVVLAAGPWTGKITRTLGLDLPLKPVRVTVLYWKPKKQEAVSNHSIESFPCFLDSRSEATLFHTYGLPINEYPGLFKACLHTGPEIDPEYRDRHIDDTEVVDKVTETVVSTFPHLDPTPCIKEYCIYTFTPDSDPYVDRHPQHQNIVIAAGFSGHGFKLAPAIGKAVSELVLDKTPTFDMTPFRIDRAKPKSNL